MRKLIVSLGLFTVLLFGIVPIDAAGTAGDGPTVNYDPDLGDVD
ncbi:hypothetical protein [Lentibacillus jeotgali]|nr:hypothetical protein [Lentibacillus jeotgali]